VCPLVEERSASVDQVPGSAARISPSGHTPILAAVLQGRPEAARAATLEHIEATRDWIVGLHLGRLPA